MVRKCCFLFSGAFLVFVNLISILISNVFVVADGQVEVAKDKHVIEGKLKSDRRQVEGSDD